MVIPYLCLASPYKLAVHCNGASFLSSVSIWYHPFYATNFWPISSTVIFVSKSFLPTLPFYLFDHHPGPYCTSGDCKTHLDHLQPATPSPVKNEVFAHPLKHRVPPGTIAQAQVHGLPPPNLHHLLLLGCDTTGRAPPWTSLWLPWLYAAQACSPQSWNWNILSMYIYCSKHIN